MARFRIAIVAAALLCASAAFLRAAPVEAKMIGINVVLDWLVTDAILADLGTHGRVLDVIPEINAVTLRAPESELAAIRALAYVAGADPDAEYFPAGAPGVPDFSDGANQWSLDAINVTDAGGDRSVGYDGEGVYVAVLDSGLPYNWREYFPEERIDSLHARAFGGGGGDLGTVSAQPEKWEHDVTAHGAAVTSIILGFRYAGGEPGFPLAFNGVAPKATVIPVKVRNQDDSGRSSVLARALVYVTGLKTGGALGDAPVVVNLSIEGPRSDVLVQAAIDHAIANGVVIVAAGANKGESGMRMPGAYPPVISAANAGWVEEFPPDDPTRISWILRDVPENDASQYFIFPDSSRELPGQDLDVTAPGTMVPAPWSYDGQLDYTFFNGTSAACPHVAGVVALMLQKNPGLTQAEIEAILEGTSLTLSPGCADITAAAAGPGNPPTWGDRSNLSYFDVTVCWDADATGHGLVQADAALAATPEPD